jgi:hypothetical protein
MLLSPSLLASLLDHSGKLVIFHSAGLNGPDKGRAYCVETAAASQLFLDGLQYELVNVLTGGLVLDGLLQLGWKFNGHGSLIIHDQPSLFPGHYTGFCLNLSTSLSFTAAALSPFDDFITIPTSEPSACCFPAL